MTELTPKTLAGYFDHTLLRPNATDDEFRGLCDDSRSYGFAMVAINSVQVSWCKKLLEGCGVHVGAAIGFPLGQTTIEAKLFETKDALNNGADEIDYVVNLSRLQAKDYAYVEKEMRAITDACRAKGATSKVILETCFLTDELKREMCAIAVDVGIDYVKTSTGFGTGGATIEDIRLMKECVGDKVKVKASGGVRTLDFALELIDAGVSRIGSTASVKIVQELKARGN